MHSPINLFRPLEFYNLTNELAEYNQHRLNPGDRSDPHPHELFYVEAIRASVRQNSTEEACSDVLKRGLVPAYARGERNPTLKDFEVLKETGPGQGDSLFPWLAEEATQEQMIWFLEQEAAGEAGFGDLLALTQVKMPVRPQLEMARNFWDEMGQGKKEGMHGLLLSRILEYFGIEPAGGHDACPETLLLNNLMIALACHRRYAYLSLGALGVIEMTAPGRVMYVDAGLKRLGVPKKDRLYFLLHATLDIQHSREWNNEVIKHFEDQPEIMREICEGAYLRLWAGSKCFERYRAELGVPTA